MVAGPVEWAGPADLGTQDEMEDKALGMMWRTTWHLISQMALRITDRVICRGICGVACRITRHVVRAVTRPIAV